MKRTIALFLAILMLFLSLGEPIYALGLTEQGLEEHEIQQEAVEREEGISTSMPMAGELSSDGVLEVTGQGAGINLYEAQSFMQPMRGGDGSDNGLTAWVEKSSSPIKGEYKSSKKADSYDIVFPVMNLKTSDTEPKVYTMKIADKAIVDNINGKQVEDSKAFVTMNIVDVQKGTIVGKIEVVEEGGSVFAKYTFDKTDVVTYTTSPLTLKLMTKETNNTSYTLLPDSSNKVTINFFGFNIEGPNLSEDKKTATVKISKKPGYQMGTIDEDKVKANIPEGVTYKKTGNDYTFTLTDGDYKTFAANFSNGVQSETKTITLGSLTPEAPKYTAGVSYDFKIDGNNLVATVTLTKDTQQEAPELPDKIKITSFNLTNRVTKDIDEKDRLVISDQNFEPIDEKRSTYKLKSEKEIDGTATDEGKTKTYKLEIPVKQWMTFKNDYNYLKASWDIKYDYDGEKTKSDSDTIDFPEENITLNRKSFVAPSAATGENFLYEKVSIYPTNNKELPDKFTLKISNREVTFPPKVKSDNKFELEGEGVEKKDPWTGYNLKKDLEFTYKLDDEKSPIKKILERDNEGKLTGKFHYEIEWSTKVTKLPNNYGPYGYPKAKSNATFSYEYENSKVTDSKTEDISFFQIVEKPSEKVQIAQRTENGKRITTWAIVFNRDHKNKAVVEIEDTIKHGSLRKDTLKYYFIDPKEKIDLNEGAINKLIEGAKANAVDSNKELGKPYYTLERADGKDHFVIKFGDHSSTLTKKIEEIKVRHKNIKDENDRKKAINIDIIKFLFSDYIYRNENAVVGETKLVSTGDYFGVPNPQKPGRNFPDLSLFTDEDIVTTFRLPFTSLVNPETAENPYYTLIKAQDATETERAYYKTVHDEDVKTDALILTYETESETKAEVNTFKSEMLRNMPDLYIYEPRKGEDKGYPKFHLEGKTAEDEVGEETGTNKQEGLYPVYKHSFIKDDMTLIKNGVLANTKGSYCEEIKIADVAEITGGELGKYTGLNLVRFKLSDFDAEITQLKAADPKAEGKSDADYEKEIYSIFIKNYINGEGITGESLPFEASNGNKTIKFQTGVTEEGFKTNKEANQFVYLFTYDMDASYSFSKIGTGKATSTISNTATVTYDGGLKVEVKSSIKKDDFLTKADITPNNEAKTSGVKKYRLTFDFTGYELKDIKEIKITDTFGAYDKFVEITSQDIRGALKEEANDTHPAVYEDAPADIKVSRHGKVFTVTSDKDLTDKKFTIIYEVKMDLSKIYNGGQGQKPLSNTATAILKNSNNPPQTIKESATASTTVEYGSFLTKKVNTWEKVTPADDASEEDKVKAKEENKKNEEEFKQSSLRHYTLTFDLEKKDFLKESDTLTVKDTFSTYHKFVKYKNVVVKEGNVESTGLKVRIVSSGNSEIVFEVTKVDNTKPFPDKFTLEYDVILQNSEIVPEEGKEYSLYNYANATFKDKQTSYTQNASVSTPVKSGTMEVTVGMFTLNINKILPDIKTGREKVKDKDYSKISFSLEGKYFEKDKEGTKTEKNYSAKNLNVSKDGSLVFEDIPFDGTYTLTETVNSNDYEALKSEIKFIVSEKGDSITFDPHCIDKDVVEVTKVNNNGNPTIEQEKDGEVVKKDIVKVVQPDKWGFVVQMDMNIHNKIKFVENHTLIFKKVDQDGKPLKGAVFKIEKLGDNGNNKPVYKESDKDGVVKFENLPNGKYKVTEIAKAPGRYTEDMAAFEIELTKDMAAEYDYGDVTNQKLTRHDISFIKADSERGENGNLIPLQGAEFKLMKKASRGEFTWVQTAISGSDGKVTFTGVSEGTYKIVESKAPIGYGLPEDTTVKVPKETSDFPWLAVEDDDSEAKTEVFEVKEDKDATYYDWSYEHEIRILPPNYPGDLLPTITIKQLVVENTKIKHSISFTKYQEVYKGKPTPMAGATFILRAGSEKIAKAESDQNGLVKFENLDNKQYYIVEAPEDKESKTNLFSDHVVNTDVINVPDLTNARDKAQNIKLFSDEDKVNTDQKFVNYKARKGFSFKKYDEALDENGQPKVMKDVEFKAYRKVDGKFEDEVYKCLNGQNPARDNFKDAVAVSNAEGNVVFTGFEPGTYKIVETRVAGYENLSFEITVSKDGVKFPKNIENGESNIVKNSYTRHEVIFKKVDKFSKTGLEGAVFKVEKLEKDGTYTLISDKVTSNAQGVVSIPGLFNGEYKITEIKTPSGYKESDVSFKFTLSDSDLPQVVMKDVENESLFNGIFFAPQGLLNKKDHAAYMYGYPDGSFRPKRPMTRAEVTTMFGRLLLKKYTESKEFRPIYPDVKKGDWYGSAVTIMSDLKLVEGYPDGTFKPNAPITRAEFATIASRFDKITGGAVNFKDLSTSHWAYSYIASAYHKGWVMGYPDGTFKPEKDISREEVVAITNRMLDRKCDLDFVKLHKRELKMFYDNPETSWSYGDIIESTNGHDYHRKNNNSIDEVWERLNKREFHI